MRTIITATLLLGALSPIQAQRADDVPLFAGGALMAGAQGFARPPDTSPVVGAYAYGSVGRFLIGAQGGTAVGNRNGSRAAYAVATMGYAQAHAMGWQFYPFIAAGAATLHAGPAPNSVGLTAGGGFGADALIDPNALGTMIGARVGYLTRSLNDDESVAYLAISVGLGGRGKRGDGTRLAASRLHRRRADDAEQQRQIPLAGAGVRCAPRG